MCCARGIAAVLVFAHTVHVKVLTPSVVQVEGVVITPSFQECVVFSFFNPSQPQVDACQCSFSSLAHSFEYVCCARGATSVLVFAHTVHVKVLTPSVVQLGGVVITPAFQECVAFSFFNPSQPQMDACQCSFSSLVHSVEYVCSTVGTASVLVFSQTVHVKVLTPSVVQLGGVVITPAFQECVALSLFNPSQPHVDACQCSFSSLDHSVEYVC